MAIEKADRDHGEARTRVTYAGETSTRTSFDPKKFALLLIEQRGKKRTLEERVRRQEEIEEKHGRRHI
ncbi:hypothetical protein AB4144_11425 [Rhizobiaceae sp. 2RAB30]